MFEEMTEYKIDNINVTNKTISIARDDVVKKDGVEIARQRHRRAFVPGDIEAVKEYTGFTSDSPEIIYLNLVWTDQVIKRHKKTLKTKIEQ